MAEQLCLLLTILITKSSIQTSTLSNAWKRGHVLTHYKLLVIPVHKKGDCKHVDNYRPVTLTSVVGKLLESIIKDHILDHFFEHILFTPYQHWFLPKRSCVTQLATFRNGKLDYSWLWTVHLIQSHTKDYCSNCCDLLQWLSDFFDW